MVIPDSEDLYIVNRVQMNRSSDSGHNETFLMQVHYRVYN